MKPTLYRCAAKPLGEKGGVCGASPSEHNIRQKNVYSPVTRRELPQHKFVPQEVRSADEG